MRALHTLGMISALAVSVGAWSQAEAATFFSITDADAFGPTTYSFHVTATSSVSQLLFAARQDPDYFDLTNISVSAGTSGNLISNGDFATGDFTGYTVAGNTGFTGVSSGSPYAPNQNFAYLGAVGSDTLLSQTFATVVGQVYAVSFSLANGGSSGAFDGPNDFSASLNAVAPVPLPPALPLFGAALIGVAVLSVRRRRETIKAC